MLLALALALSVSQPPQQPPQVFTLQVQDQTGYTRTVTLNVFSPQVADMLQKYLEKKTLQDDIQNYGNGGEWTDYAMSLEIGHFLSFICGAFSAGVTYTGALNIWIDAAAALCASIAIVTEVSWAGKQIYEAYMRSIAGQNQAVWFAILGNCGASGVPAC